MDYCNVREDMSKTNRYGTLGTAAPAGLVCGWHGLVVGRTGFTLGHT